jgi:hypothetical protein
MEVISAPVRIPEDDGMMLEYGGDVTRYPDMEITVNSPPSS